MAAVGAPVMWWEQWTTWALVSVPALFQLYWMVAAYRRLRETSADQRERWALQVGARDALAVSISHYKTGRADNDLRKATALLSAFTQRLDAWEEALRVTPIQSVFFAEKNERRMAGMLFDQRCKELTIAINTSLRGITAASAVIESAAKESEIRTRAIEPALEAIARCIRDIEKQTQHPIERETIARLKSLSYDLEAEARRHTDLEPFLASMATQRDNILEEMQLQHVMLACQTVKLGRIDAAILAFMPRVKAAAPLWRGLVERFSAMEAGPSPTEQLALLRRLRDDAGTLAHDNSPESMQLFSRRTREAKDVAIALQTTLGSLLNSMPDLIQRIEDNRARAIADEQARQRASDARDRGETWLAIELREGKKAHIAHPLLPERRSELVLGRISMGATPDLLRNRRTQSESDDELVELPELDDDTRDVIRDAMSSSASNLLSAIDMSAIIGNGGDVGSSGGYDTSSIVIDFGGSSSGGTDLGGGGDFGGSDFSGGSDSGGSFDW